MYSVNHILIYIFIYVCCVHPYCALLLVRNPLNEMGSFHWTVCLAACCRPDPAGCWYATCSRPIELNPLNNMGFLATALCETCTQIPWYSCKLTRHCPNLYTSYALYSLNYIYIYKYVCCVFQYCALLLVNTKCSHHRHEPSKWNGFLPVDGLLSSVLSSWSGRMLIRNMFSHHRPEPFKMGFFEANTPKAGICNIILWTNILW